MFLNIKYSNMKKIILFLLIIFLSQSFLSQSYYIYSQVSAFYFDIIITKGLDNDSSNVDFYCCVPNQTLKFNRQGNKFVADFSLSVSFVDSSANKTNSFEIKKNAIADDFEKSQGINSDFTLINNSIKLLSGNYRVRVLLKDNISGKEYTASRTISVVNYDAFDFSISSILLLSSIEEQGEEYIITPYLNDNVSMLNEGYFAFFEVYNNKEQKDINITTEIRNNDNDKVIYNTGITKNVDTGTTQCYIKIPADIKYGLGNNTLKIFVSEGILGAAGDSDSDVKILAAASRSIRSISNINERILKNLTNSIRQLKYVATSSQIDSINKAETDADKMRLFEAFWKRLDPTPHTEKNEAMEEYYRRIDYANENFKAYQEGWLTDKGHIFVVFGAPINVDRTNNSMADNRTFERWTYPNNRVIIFLDVSGFGDFRLYSPSIITDKYQFEY